MQMLGVGLTYSPSLQLVNGISCRIQIVMFSDLGQIGAVAPPVALMVFSPGQKFTRMETRTGCIGR